MKLAKSDEVKKEINGLKEKFRMLSSEITDRLASKSDLARSDTQQKQYINQNFVTFEQNDKQAKKIIQIADATLLMTNDVGEIKITS